MSNTSQITIVGAILNKGGMNGVRVAEHAKAVSDSAMPLLPMQRVQDGQA